MQQELLQLPDPCDYSPDNLPPDWVRIQSIIDTTTEFKPWFAGWLITNFHIWEAFRRQADFIARLRKHYSARTIIENIRHQSVLAEKDGAFKINNNVAPQFARLYVRLTGNKEFFERRYREAA